MLVLLGNIAYCLLQAVFIRSYIEQYIVSYVASFYNITSWVEIPLNAIMTL